MPAATTTYLYWTRWAGWALMTAEMGLLILCLIELIYGYNALFSLSAYWGIFAAHLGLALAATGIAASEWYNRVRVDMEPSIPLLAIWRNALVALFAAFQLFFLILFQQHFGSGNTPHTDSTISSIDTSWRALFTISTGLCFSNLARQGETLVAISVSPDNEDALPTLPTVAIEGANNTTTSPPPLPYVPPYVPLANLPPMIPTSTMNYVPPPMTSYASVAAPAAATAPFAYQTPLTAVTPTPMLTPLPPAPSPPVPTKGRFRQRIAR